MTDNSTKNGAPPAPLKHKKRCDQAPMQHAIMELIVDFDFDGYLLTHFDCKIVEEIPNAPVQTAALLYSNGRFFIRCVEKFFCSLTDSERVAVLKHEIAHFINKHMIRRNGRVPHLFNIACLPPTEKIQTSKGLTEICKIKEGYKVYGSEGTLVNVSRTMHSSYEGKLYTIKGVGAIPIIITNDHPVLVATRKKETNISLQPPKWKKASELQKGKDYLLIPTLKKSFSKRTLNLKEFFPERSRLNRLAKGIKDRKLPLTKELAWILGMYTSEGSRINKDFELVFSLHKDEKYFRNRISRYFKSLGYKPIENTISTRKCIDIQIPSEILGKAFSKWCGRGAVNKKVPDFILHNTRSSIIESFLDGYFEGDGFRTKSYQRIAVTISKQLALHTQQLIGRLGLFAPIGIIPARSRILFRNTIHGKTQYTITWSISQLTNRVLPEREIECNSCKWKIVENYFAIPITEIVTEPYKGDVYNITTENQTFLINNIISHNCDMAINQNIPHLPKDCIDLPKGWKEHEAMEYYYNELEDKVNNERDQKIILEQFDSVQDAPDNETGDAESMTTEVIRETVKERLDAGIEISKLRGLHAGALEEYIDELTKPPLLDWKHALSRFTATLADQVSRRTLKRPDRRGLTPYGKKKEYLPKLIICVDTSGSVSDELLATFFSQINLLGRMLSEVNVVIADAQVHEHFLYKRGMEEKLRESGLGRGGTDFDPAVQYINKHLRDNDGAVYLTDGWCPTPETRCKVPMIWIVTQNKDFEGKPRIYAEDPGKGKRRR